MSSASKCVALNEAAIEYTALIQHQTEPLTNEEEQNAAESTAFDRRESLEMSRKYDTQNNSHRIKQALEEASYEHKTYTNLGAIKIGNHGDLQVDLGGKPVNKQASSIAKAAKVSAL